ncbi:MAG: 2-C-methyl-D-erythritol 4-phosphate cytidylyltransferase [Planctomycetota bacterium]|nr:2-C-methyl-D-erythritol 4-phosphate cytidylyltransferase [Planctomycetota bacterium]MDA1177997.1 2-C-methyl-D-erythritol 4-phosphate cytidylyltransferase [Planctomycetota bacterium]
MPDFAVIIPAAGKSTRFSDPHFKKPFALLDNRPVWLHSAEKFINRSDVKQVLIVISPEDEEFFREKFGANVAFMGFDVVRGGAERADSVQRALEKVHADLNWIAVHDAVRPCLADAWIDRVFDAATQSGAAILATPVTATLKRSDPSGKQVQETIPRADLWEAQTPQVFRKDLLLKAYAARGSFQPTDEAQLIEKLGHPVAIVQGSPMNLKITTKEDLKMATQVLKALPKPALPNLDHPFADDHLWR